MEDLGVGRRRTDEGEVVEVERGSREDGLDGGEQLLACSLQRRHDGGLGALRVGGIPHGNPSANEHNPNKRVTGSEGDRARRLRKVIANEHNPSERVKVTEQGD